MKKFDKQLKIGIPREFVEFCEYHKTNPEFVLHQFIADVCGLMSFCSNPRADGLSSGGSDERDLALHYFKRTSIGWMSEYDQDSN